MISNQNAINCMNCQPLLLDNQILEMVIVSDDEKLWRSYGEVMRRYDMRWFEMEQWHGIV